MEDRTADKLREAIESLEIQIGGLMDEVHTLSGLIEDDLVPALKDAAKGPDDE